MSLCLSLVAGPGSEIDYQYGPGEKSEPGAECGVVWRVSPPDSGRAGPGLVFEGGSLCFQINPVAPCPPVQDYQFALRPEKNP